jgi:hypothetical protein
MNGMNPYVGLQDFVSWENCGIQRGKLEVDKKTGEMEFIPNESSPRWAVRHLGKTVPSTQIFTPEVFTEDVLRQLDENVIQPHFKLPDLFDESELEDLVNGEAEEQEVTESNGEE